MRVAIVHDWLTGMRGGEKVLDAICELYPDAPIYTLVRVPGTVGARIESRRIRTSLAQRFPRPGRLYRYYLPLYPWMVELFDLDGYDLVISSNHCAVKSVVATGRAVHVCYCHSPMRYAWDQFPAYFGPEAVGRIASGALRRVMARLAAWDAATADRADRFLANSQYVAGRIRRYYNRGSTVVYPPVDTDYYNPGSDGRRPSPSTGPGFLVVSALVPYKRLDLAIDACRRAGVPLTIVGSGPERERLERLAGPDVRFTGWAADDEIRELYRQATALLLPGIEDFGMAPVEAQACGCPVIALDGGGARETVVDGETGFLVAEPSAEAFADALDRAARTSFELDALRANALRFSRDRFLTAFSSAVDAAVGTASASGRRARGVGQGDGPARAVRDSRAPVGEDGPPE
jgi:glycosyltransferase involved in cell wall biosynthesis